MAVVLGLVRPLTMMAHNIIVNRQSAETFWHGENAIGKRLRFYKKDVAQPWLTVVGIVPNIASENQSRSKRGPMLYLPYGLETQSGLVTIVARGGGGAGAATTGGAGGGGRGASTGLM